MAVNHIVIPVSLAAAAHKGILQNNLQQVLDLLTGQRQATIGHLDPVVAQIEVAAGNHHARTALTVAGRRVVSRRSQHRADVGRIQAAGDNPGDQGLLQTLGGRPVIAAHKNMVGIELLRQIGAQRLAHQGRQFGSKLRILPGDCASNIIFAKNGLDYLWHIFLPYGQVTK